MKSFSTCYSALPRACFIPGIDQRLSPYFWSPHGDKVGSFGSINAWRPLPPATQPAGFIMIGIVAAATQSAKHAASRRTATPLCLVRKEHSRRARVRWSTAHCKNVSLSKIAVTREILPGDVRQRGRSDNFDGTLPKSK